MTELFSAVLEPQKYSPSECSLFLCPGQQLILSGFHSSGSNQTDWLCSHHTSEQQQFKFTHQHTPWSHCWCAGSGGSLHNIVRCANTSPPYILCKNCDWNMLHSCLFYILEDKRETQTEAVQNRGGVLPKELSSRHMGSSVHNITAKCFIE